MPDFLLRRAAGDLIERLDGVKRDFSHILTLGLGSELIADIAASSLPTTKLLISANAAGMQADGGRRVPAIFADEEFLPFKSGSFDLILSALSLHHVNDLPGALIQIRRALKPDGLFAAAVLGGATLQELREAFMEAEMQEEGGVSPRVAPMADIRDYGGLLQRAGFALPVADSDVVTVTYSDPLALMLELRAMGAGNVLAARQKKPLRRTTLYRAIEIYGERFAAEGGRVKATFEIIHLAGWAPHESQQKPLKPGSAAARLADALGVEEHQLKNGSR